MLSPGTSHPSLNDSFYRDLVDAIPQLVWVSDDSGAPLFINRRCLEYTGSPLDGSSEAIYHWVSALHPEDVESSHRAWDLAVRNKTIFQCEYRLRRFDGEYQWFLGRAEPITRSDQSLLWLGTATNIEAHKQLMNDLKLSRDELNVILEGVTDGITVLNHEGEIIYVNEAGARMSGFKSAKEMLSLPTTQIMKAFEFLDEDGNQIDVSQLPGRRALRGETDIPELTIKTKDLRTGEFQWAIIKAAPIFDDVGRVKMAVSIFKDFTERKENENLLKQRERETRLLVETIPHLAWMAKANGVCDWVNQRWSEYTGLGITPNSAFCWTRALESDDRLKAEERWRESLHTGEPFEYEYELRNHQTNELRWHIVRALPASEDRSGIRRWFGTCTDIHEFKLAQEGMKRAEEMARFIAEAGIVLSTSLESGNTLERLMELITPRLADWCRIDLVESVSQLPPSLIRHKDPLKLKWAMDLTRKYPTDWSASHGVAQVIRTGQSELYEVIPEELLVRIARDEEHFEIIKSLGMKSAMVVPIVGKSKIFGAITLISSESNRHYSKMDLTAAEDVGRRAGVAIGKAQLYQSEKDLREKAELASQAKSTFLANMSHEMRTPLNALIGFNDLLRQGEVSESERNKYHDIIERNGELLLRLIDDILDLSKVEAGHLTLEHTPVSLPDLLSEVSEVLQRKAIDKGLDFRIDLKSGLPETIVTDPLRLKQILNNTIGNAIKFTSQGRVELTVDHDSVRKKVRFKIEDTGPGIATEFRKNLFKPFSQGDPSLTRKFGGTGLGLAVSRKLAQSLGGNLYLEDNQPESGASFLFEISSNLLSKESEDRSIEATESRYAKTYTELLLGKRVLLVEDSPDNRLLVECVLKSKNVIVEMAENGKIGVERALSEKFDLVLMDLQMPIMDGYSALKVLQENGYDRPVIALSAHAMQEERERCMKLGCVDYVTKPVKPAVLIDSVARNLIHH